MEKLSRIRALPVQRRFFDCGLRRISADRPLPEWLPVEAYQRAQANEQALYEVAISSEYPVPRWFGIETLRHDRSAIDMSYLKRGAAVLVDHGGDQVGVVEAARLGDDKVLRGVVRFSRSARGQEIERDVVDGIRRFISVGYQWLEARIVGEDDKHGEQWEVTRWKPMEVSFVAVPADVTVGVGRAAETTRAIPFKFRDAADAQPEITMNEEIDRPSRSARRAAAQQNAEAADIIGMCTREGKPELAERFLREGKSADEVGRFLLSARDEVTPEQLRAPFGFGMDRPGYTPVQRGGETLPRGYSLANALRALADGENSVELEFSRDLAREHRYTQRANGVLVPLGYVFGMQQRAVIDSATTNAAKELVFTQQGNFIDLLRPLSVTAKLGATILPGLVGPVGFPRQTAAATGYWVAENPGADVTESNLTTDLVTLAPKTIQATTAFTRQLLTQSSIGVEDLVRRDLSRVHALAIDRAALHGAGSATEPAGLYTIAGVNSHAVGGAPTFADIIDMQTMVAVDNGISGPMGWATTPGMAGKLMQTLVASAAGSAMIWTGTYEDGRLGGYRAFASNQLSSTLGAGTNEHGILFGNWSDLLIGLWGAFEVIVDPYAQKKRGIIEVTTFQMADIDVRHPESFVKGTGATL